MRNLKIDNASPADVPSFDGRVPPPDFVNIETTKYCNLRCDMCHQFQDGTVITGPHLELERFERWADQTLPFATRFQPSVTGEPLMSKGLPKMLEKAASYGVRLDIVTNATLLNARMRAMLLPWLGKVTISFDGASEAGYQAVRIGADFDKVVANVRALCAEVAELPPTQRPLLVLAGVLMRRNIDEAPALVELAHDMGIHWLEFSHMFPPTDELKRESLVHDVPRAKARLDEAFARAEELGLPLSTQSLDQVIAISATSVGGRREFSTVDGVVEGLEARAVNMDRIPPWPSAPAGDAASIRARREQAKERAQFAAFRERESVAHEGDGVAAQLPDSIWVCDFLWNKSYVTLNGDVRTCCVPGTPVVGNIEREPFERIWDDPIYAAMRSRIAHKDPAPVCKGCQHIHEVRDPDAIAKFLGQRPLPEGGWQEELPVILDPQRLAGLDSEEADDAAPTLHWEAARGASRYEVELSLDGFKTIAFANTWHDEEVTENHYRIPAWAWDQAPAGHTVHWRSVAILPEVKLEVGLGALTKR